MSSTRRLRAALPLVALSVSLALPAAALSSTEGAAEAIWARARAARDDAAPVAASAAQRLGMRRLLGELVASAPLGEVPEGARARAWDLGFSLEQVGELLVLAPTAPSAGGLYAVRLGGEAPPILLQAPHAWYDTNTGPIACALFEAGYARALFLNTAHRYRKRAPQPEGDAAEGDDDGDDALPPADLAHLSDTLFQAATLGAAEAVAGALVIQIHGFGASHGPWSVVAADGEAIQGGALLASAVERVGGALAAYGEPATGVQVPALAATTNAQGRALYARAGFLHLELSAPARADLRQDPALQRALGEALAAVATE